MIANTAMVAHVLVRLRLATSARLRVAASACFLMQLASPAVPDNPPPTEAASTAIELTVVGGSSLNPNSQGRASPVVVRIFDLSATQVFESADYTTLFENPTDALQHDVLAQEELILRPGDVQERNRELKPGVAAIGVAAGFRDLDHAKWRIVVHIEPGKRNFLLVDLDQQRIRLDPIESHPK